VVTRHDVVGKSKMEEKNVSSPTFDKSYFATLPIFSLAVQFYQNTSILYLDSEYIQNTIPL
jgi:hypothetical protein